MDKQYRRYADKPDADNSLQYNASAKHHGPFPLSSMASPGAGYTGYDSTGRWLESGVRTSDALHTNLGNSVHNLDSTKWSVTSTVTTHSQQASQYVVKPTAAGQKFELSPSADASGNQWKVLSGPFDLTFDFATVGQIPSGVGSLPSQQNLVYIQVKSVAAGTVARVKLCRTNVGDPQIAANVDGVGDLLGATPTSSTVFRLGVERDEAGSLKLWGYGTVPDTAYTLLSQTAMPGDLYVSVGVESVVAGVWVANLYSVGVGSAPHTWSPWATWARESTDGSVFDLFRGTSLGPVWSTTTSGAGATSVSNGVSLSSDGVGGASIHHPAVAGDFSISAEIEWSRKNFSMPMAAITAIGGDVAFALDLEPDVAVYPRYRVAVKYYRDGAGKYWTIAQIEKWTAANAATVLASDSVSLMSKDETTFAVSARKIGGYLSVDISDSNGVGTLSAEASGNQVPSVPWKPTILSSATSGANASVGCKVVRYRLDCSGAVPSTGMPATVSAISSTADPSELQPYLTTKIPEGSEVRLVALDQSLGFSIVGASQQSPHLEFEQAMAGAQIGQVWADEDGRLWIPTSRSASAATGGFICVDFKSDRIYRYRHGTIETFGGGVSHRNICFGYSMTNASAANAPPSGDALAYRRMKSLKINGGGDHTSSVWVTSGGVTSYNETLGVAHPAFAGTIRRAAFVEANEPDGADTKATLVLAVSRAGDEAVAVYRDVSTVSAESFAGESADAIYTGSSPVVANSDMVAGKLVGAANGVNIQDVDAVRRADGNVVIAVARGSLGACIIEDSASPASAPTHFWTPTNGQPSADPGRALGYSPVGVALSQDATLTTGYMCVSTAESIAVSGGGTDNAGTVEVFALASLDKGVRYRATPASADPTMAGSSDRRSTPSGVAILPPEDGVGIRVGWGTSAATVQVSSVATGTGSFEYTPLSVSGGPWGSWHFGGAKIDISGRGLESVKELTISGVSTAMLVTTSTGLSCVARSLGYILTGEPAVSDTLVESGGPWSYDLVIKWSDGGTMLVSPGITYTANQDVEAMLYRTLQALPERVLETDTKADSYQRHILLAIAASVDPLCGTTIPTLESDTYIDTATGPELVALCGDYSAAPPAALGLSDASVRLYARAVAFGSRMTAKAIKDLVFAAVGVTPVVTEGYRSLTLSIPLSLQSTDTYLADQSEPGGSYLGGAYWSGDDPRVQALAGAIKSQLAGGVDLTVRIT